MKVPLVFVRSAYNYDRNAASLETALICEDESLAIQSMRDEADINVIARNFGLTGLMPLARMPPTYGDFSMVSDYQSAIALIDEAQDSFMGLEADVRARFDNDPGKFVAFVDGNPGRDELVAMGLAVPEPVAAPAAPPAAPPPATVTT